MKRSILAVVILAVAACGGSTPTPTPIGNTGTTPPEEAAAVDGTIRDSATHEPLSGATVVVDAGDTFTDGGEASAISDVDGRYHIGGVKPGRNTVTIYYVDFTIRRHVDVHGVTIVDQQIGTNTTSNLQIIECSGETVDTCH